MKATVLLASTQSQVLMLGAMWYGLVGSACGECPFSRSRARALSLYPRVGQ
jgi:hypothetical protein